MDRAAVCLRLKETRAFGFSGMEVTSLPTYPPTHPPTLASNSQHLIRTASDLLHLPMYKQTSNHLPIHQKKMETMARYKPFLVLYLPTHPPTHSVQHLIRKPSSSSTFPLPHPPTHLPTHPPL